MDKLKEFLNGKPLWIKVVILIAIGILVFFSSYGCALKADLVHFEGIDSSIGVKNGSGSK